MKTQNWGDIKKAKILVIGHDPRLQFSNTQANYAFFADYYFRQKPNTAWGLAKYELAEKLFNYLNWLTNNKYTDDEFLITNLCNEHLPNAPPKKTVYIPLKQAQEGLEDIKKILFNSKIKLILATSHQVNYWLQKLNFYTSNDDFLIYSEPKTECIKLNYYEPILEEQFLKICGRQFSANGIPLFPVLHVKQYPIKSEKYLMLLKNCILKIKKI